MSDMSVIAPWAGSALGALFLGYSLRAGKKRRLVDDTPTCKTTGVFIGMVELKGTAEAGSPLRSFLAECDCVSYEWSVDEHWSRTVTETYTDSNGKTQTRTRRESGWKTVAQGNDIIPFYLKDDCGVVQVIPNGAEVEPVTMFSQSCGRSDPLYYLKGPREAVSDSDHERRFVERGIPLHQPIYVMGYARERRDIVAAEIAMNLDAPIFLISTRPEEAISGGMASAFVWWGLGGLLLMEGGILIGFSNRQVTDEMVVWLGVGPAALYVVCWFLGWAWMVFNSVVGLRQRVKQAWSQVDVQLKRRHDLIPNLVSTVKGLRDYETKLQTEVATMRAQMTATPPGEPGADYSGIAPLLLAIEEQYPELKTEESFLNLQKNLIDTEHRIALARGYYNEIASFYNTRLEVVPDRFLAAVAGMKPQPLLLAETFERQPVELRFAE